MLEKIYVPLAALNAYSYCAYRMYLEYVQCEWQDNVHTIEGILRHERAHSEEKRYEKDKVQSTQVFVRSEQYKLVGKIDIVEDKNNKVYSVEYKKGRARKWINDHVQLCAQALCLEEQIGQKIEEGYLWYFTTRSREKVIFDEELRAETIEISKQAWQVMDNELIPKKEYIAKCRACSMKRVCLPQEVAILQQKGRK